MDEVRASRARLNQTSADFLKVDVQTALIFCIIARGTEDPVKRLRNRRHARQGYDSILHFIEKVDLSKEDAEFLSENLGKLKTELVSLGEHL